VSALHLLQNTFGYPAFRGELAVRIRIEARHMPAGEPRGERAPCDVALPDTLLFRALRAWRTAEAKARKEEHDGAGV
jgi:hypothetical protein